MNQENPEQKFVCAVKEDDSWESFSPSEYEVVEKEVEKSVLEMKENVAIYSGEIRTKVMTDDNQNAIASSPNVLPNVQKVGAGVVGQNSQALSNVDRNVCEIIPSTKASGIKNQIHGVRRKTLTSSIGGKGMMYNHIKVGERHTKLMTDENQNIIALSPNLFQNIQKVGARDAGQDSEALSNVYGNVSEITPSTKASVTKNRIHDVQRKKLKSSFGGKGVMYHHIKVGERHTKLMTDEDQISIASSPNVLRNVRTVDARDFGQNSEAIRNVDENGCEIIPSTKASGTKNQIRDVRGKKLNNSAGGKGMLYRLIKVGCFFVAVSYLVRELTSYNQGWYINHDLYNQSLDNYSLNNNSGMHLDICHLDFPSLDTFP